MIFTEWQNFKVPDVDVIKAELKTPVIIVSKNLFDPERMEAKGIEYYAVGRGLSAVWNAYEAG